MPLERLFISQVVKRWNSYESKAFGGMFGACSAGVYERGGSLGLVLAVARRGRAMPHRGRVQQRPHAAPACSFFALRLSVRSSCRAQHQRQVRWRPAIVLPVRARPNHSFNPRLATAGAVSLVRASSTIVAYQAYSTRLRSRG